MPLPQTPPVAVREAILCGYASRNYAHSLAEFGAVEHLPRSGGSLLIRPTPDGSALDAMGPYPLFACRDWSRLGDDLAALADRLVAVSLVADPFADVSVAELQSTFPDVCYAYKNHYVADLSRDLDETLPTNHRRNVAKALSRLDVRRVEPDGATLANWIDLYDNLINRHNIVGIARFSPVTFERQMHVSGFTAFAAHRGDEVRGMTLWFVQGSVAYYHLAAYSDEGYEAGASFALFATAFRAFAEQGVAWASLGAGAGTTAADSGLTRFKEGWSTETRPAYFCGRILHPETYRRLGGGGDSSTSFFPAYRRGFA